MAIDGIIAAGSTEVITRVFLFKDSGATAGTEGDPFTGLVYNSTGLIIGSIRDDEGSVTAYTTTGSTIEDITAIGTHVDPSASKVRIKEIDSTNMPGWYEMQWLDARWAAGAAEHIVTITGVADLATASFRYVLDSITLSDINSELGTYGVPTVTQMNARTLVAAEYATDTQQQTIIDELSDFSDGTTKPQVDVREINGNAVTGSGDSSSKWRKG